MHSNNSPDDDLSNGSPSKHKSSNRRLKWVLVSEGSATQLPSAEQQAGTLKLFLNRIKTGGIASEVEAQQ